MLKAQNLTLHLKPQESRSNDWIIQIADTPRVVVSILTGRVVNARGVFH